MNYIWKEIKKKIFKAKGLEKSDTNINFKKEKGKKYI